MNSDTRDVVSLGADVGGKDAHSATHAHILSFRRILQQKCKGPYSNAIKELAFVLRIDGSVQAWGKKGVDNVSLQRKKSFLTADIFMPINEWSGCDAAHIRRFIAAGLGDAIERVGDYAQRKNIDLAIDALRQDVGAAISEFLA